MKVFAFLLSLFATLPTLAAGERNCGYDGVVERAYLSCVACGVKDVVGRTPSFRYLSLLAVAANQYTELDTANRPGRKNNNITANFEARNNFYRLMAEQIQAYGFCLDKKIDNNGNITTAKGYGHLTREDWREVTPLIVNSVKAPGSALRSAAKTYGFASDEAMKETLSPGANWDKMTAKERQAAFRTHLNKALKPNTSGEYGSKNDVINIDESNGQGLEDCMRQLNTLQTRNGSMFNYQSSAYTERSKNLCKSISISCGITDANYCNEPTPRVSAPVAKKPEASSTSENDKFNLFDSTKGAK